MTNIDKIRKEIERLYDEEAPKHDQQCEFEDGYFTGIATISKFIDSLPEEKPSDDLEEAADEYYDNTFDELGGFAETRDGSYDIFFPSEAIRRSFIAGAKWQANQLLKGSPLPEDTVLFQKGVEEGKRLLTEEAVEGEIGYWNQRGLSIRLDKSLERLGYDMDTKVKIIIIKDND